MIHAALIYPHQLYADHPALVNASQAVLVEGPLLFNQYFFHRQKLIFHRASMMQFAAALRKRRIKVLYIEAAEMADTAVIARQLKQLQIRSVQYVDPCDDWLSTRLAAALNQQGIAAAVLDDPHFLTPPSVIRDFTVGKERLYFTGFYIAQRKRLGLLLEKDEKPVGGQWSFDPDNRKNCRGASPSRPCHAFGRDDPSAQLSNMCGRTFPKRLVRTRSLVIQPTMRGPPPGSTPSFTSD